MVEEGQINCPKRVENGKKLPETWVENELTSNNRGF
jgi:hypothetical protein